MQISELKQSEKEQLDKYQLLINEYNKHMNLTGIDDYDGVYEKHYYDSLRVIELFSELNINSIMDLGTGMGVPGIILAIMLKDVKIYLVEPMTKRCKFLEVVKKELHLSNVEIINDRIEKIDIKADLVICRAVAKLSILLELSNGSLNKNSYFIAMKSQKLNEELDDAKNALKLLHYEVVKVQNYNLKSDNSIRNNILLRKNKEVENYPRDYSLIKKKPL